MAATAPNLPYSPVVRSTVVRLEHANLYTRLREDQIRLVELQGLIGGVINCRLRVETRVADLGYCAISYQWEPKTGIWYHNNPDKPATPDQVDRAIRVDGTLVKVSEKAANLLARMLHLGKTVVWLDQISINQTKNENREKSEQVKTMGQVYGFADEVICVLSSPTTQTDFFLAPVACADAYVEENIANAISQRHSQMYNARTSFLSNAYWTRSWILEEINMARRLTLVCGQQVARFESVASLVLRLQERPGRISWFRSAFHDVRSHWGRESNPGNNIADHVSSEFEIFAPNRQTHFRNIPFLEVLQRSRRFHGCYDHRDLLYSRLALASDANTLLPNVDYDMPVRDLYMQFARTWVTTYRSLEIIALSSWYYDVRDRHAHRLGLPSWVPDWTSRAGCWDAATGTDQFGLDNELSLISWQLRTGPKVNPQNHEELLVPGRQIATIQQAKYHPLIRLQTKAESAYRQRHPELTTSTDNDTDTPMDGDLVCVLKGAPFFVCLRRYGNHYCIKGRNFRWQQAIIVYQLGGVIDTQMRTEGQFVSELRQYGWSFVSLERVQNLPETTYNIR